MNQPGQITNDRYVLNLNTRQIHEVESASGRCRLKYVTRFVSSNDLRTLRTHNQNSPQMSGKLNRICEHCIGSH